jgi:amino acid adenylation domain-containing protein
MSSGVAAAGDRDAYVFPLSFAQARLWVIDQLAPQSTLYNLRFAVRLQQGVDVQSLQRAINAVVERHEALRTVFRLVDGEPAQVVLPSVPVALECFDLRALPAERREADAVRLATDLGHQPFDLRQGPLLRTMLIWLGPADYALVMSVHHIVADGWSMGVLAHELAVFYESFRVGRGSVLSPLAVQYADFAVWQREWLSGERLGEQLGYWRGVLAGLPVLGLPLDRVRPAVQAHRGAGLSFVLPGRLVERLGGLARESGSTLFMVLLAGYAVVLGRWSGQEEVVVGAPIAGRNRAELEGLIGFFVNTLVLRLDLSGDPSFVELVGRVREVALGAYAHADLPFEKLVEELAPGRDLSRNPLFQVTFQLFESPSAPDAVQAQPGLELPVSSSLFDLRLDLSPAADGLAGRVEYDTDLFERSSIEWLLERYRFALEQLVAGPGRPLSGLSLLPPAQARLLAGWNATAASVPGGCVHDLVEARAAAAPAALALADGEGVWSYGELNARANRLARRLRARGVGAGELVAICLPRGRAFAACALAALKAGAAYLPLDAAYPAARLAHLLADAGPRVLLTNPVLAEVLPLPPGSELVTLPPWPEEEEESGDLGLPLEPSAPAYVIYTSGSTGVPKGVVVEHQSLLNLVAWHTRAYRLGPADRGSQIASVGFDAAVWELWPYLCAGASVHVCDDETRADGERLLAWLAANEVTVAFIPTPLAETLLERPWPPEAKLRYLLTGGDTLRRFANPAHPYTLVNHYGPTETTVVATAGPVAAEPSPGRLPGIGAPIANTACYVVDRHGQLLGPGCPGELWIGGAGLARGYHRDPELSATRFLANPFADEPPRLYRSGDLVRWQPDGTLAFLGRADNQIKIRGYRIEPGEIETLLRQHPDIAQALVTTRPDTNGTPQLIAYTTTKDGVSPSGTNVRRWLRGRLPDAMIPAAVVALEVLPITDHGKIDYDALPEPNLGDRDVRSSAAPSNPCEEALCRLWADFLSVEYVGVDDDFFELGGHSLLATQLVSRIRDAFRFELPLRTLFERPTVAEIAAILRAEAGPAEHVDRAAAVFLKVMALSDEEVGALLSARGNAEERAAS